MIQPRYYEQRFIMRMKELGYATDAGMCFGLAHMGMQATLANEMDLFNERLRIIHQYTVVELIQKLEELKQRRIDLILQAQIKMLNQIMTEVDANKFNIEWKDQPFDINQLNTEAKIELRKKLDMAIRSLPAAAKKQFDAARSQLQQDVDNKFQPDELIVLDLPAFFDGVELYHKAYHFPYLFEEKERPVRQEAHQAKTYLTPKKLTDKNREITKATQFNGIYNEFELIKYFTNLRHAIYETEQPLNQPLSLVLDGSDHAISIAYDPSKQSWLIIDANNLPAFIIKNEDELAKEIQKAFMKKPTAFTTHVYVANSTQDHKQQNSVSEDELSKINEKIQRWRTSPEMQEMHSVTSQKANLQEEICYTWLHVAARDGDFELVKKLVSAGANIDAKSANSVCPLFLAVQSGNIKMVKFLLTKGANPHIKDNENSSPLSLAASLGNTDMVRLLLSPLGARPNVVGKQNQTLLGIAASHEHLATVKLLLNEKADPNYQEEGAVPALVSAMSSSNLEVVKLLLDSKADPNRAELSQNLVPLHLAIQLGLHEITEELLKQGAKTNLAFQADTSTLLDIAKKQGKHDQAHAFLLSKNNNRLPLYSKIANFSSLHLAIWCGNAKAVKTLLEQKENIQQKTLGTTALEMAKIFDNKEVLKIIDRHLENEKKLNQDKGFLGFAFNFFRQKQHPVEPLPAASIKRLDPKQTNNKKK